MCISRSCWCTARLKNKSGNWSGNAVFQLQFSAFVRFSSSYLILYCFLFCSHKLHILSLNSTVFSFCHLLVSASTKDVFILPLRACITRSTWLGTDWKSLWLSQLGGFRCTVKLFKLTAMKISVNAIPCCLHRKSAWMSIKSFTLHVVLSGVASRFGLSERSDTWEIKVPCIGPSLDVKRMKPSMSSVA